MNVIDLFLIIRLDVTPEMCMLASPSRLCAFLLAYKHLRAYKGRERFEVDRRKHLE